MNVVLQNSKSFFHLHVNFADAYHRKKRFHPSTPGKNTPVFLSKWLSLPRFPILHLFQSQEIISGAFKRENYMKYRFTMTGDLDLVQLLPCVAIFSSNTLKSCGLKTYSIQFAFIQISIYSYFTESSRKNGSSRSFITVTLGSLRVGIFNILMHLQFGNVWPFYILNLNSGEDVVLMGPWWWRISTLPKYRFFPIMRWQNLLTDAVGPSPYSATRFSG